MESKIFSPFRSVGLCSNLVPLSVSARGTSVLIATSIGEAFHVYEVHSSNYCNYNYNDCTQMQGEKLRLLFASE